MKRFRFLFIISALVILSAVLVFKDNALFSGIIDKLRKEVLPAV